MKTIVATLLVGVLAGCQGPAGSSCTVKDNGNGTSTISCTDGTTTVIKNGTNATCTVAPSDGGRTKTITCSDGSTYTVSDGTDGTSCTVKPNVDAGTTVITCADGTTATVTNGTSGTTCTVKDNGDRTKTISCTDGTKVTVTDGTTPGLPLKITDIHGRAALTAKELAAGKYYATATITSATAATDGTVTVDFTVAYNGKAVTGLPKGTFSANVAKLMPPATGESFTRWVPYIWRVETVVGTTYPKPDGTKAEQAYRENNGTLTDHLDGTYTYVFATKIAAITTPVTSTAISYDRNRKHRIGIMMGGSTGATASAHHDFVPDGSTDSTSRALLDTTACKSCHGPSFAGHGGDRVTFEICASCHVPGSTDAQSGNTLDLKVMVHKIHAGEHLDSIAGPDGIVWDDPATTKDESADNGFYGMYGYKNNLAQWWDVGFPALIENCTKCHQGSGADVDNWKNKPSREACGSCHDEVNFVTGAKHGKGSVNGGAQTDDSNCITACHQTAGTGLAPSITGAHDFVVKDPRKVEEFKAAMTVSNVPSRGYFVAGEAPVVKLALTDAVTNQLIDHTTMVSDDAVTAIPPGNGPEGCVPNVSGTDCTVPRDGKFTGAKLFVHGPRGGRNPVLSTLARVVVKSTNPGPYNLTDAAFKTALALKVDAGQDIFGSDSSGGDVVLAASFSVPVYTTGASGEVISFADTTHFTDATQTLLGVNKTWRDHQYVGYTITFTDNSTTGKPTQVLKVVDNIGATVTLDAPLTLVTLPTTRLVTYAMTGGLASAYINIATGGTTGTLVDGAQANVATQWTTDQWKGFTIKILAGTGVGQTATVASNTATTVTFDSSTPMAVAPDATSIYILQPFANLAAATSAEVVNWLNANKAFKARAIAYLDGSAIASTTAAAVAIGATTFSVKAGDGVMFPLSGNLTLDRVIGDGNGPEETVTYTRVGDVFTVPATVKAHASKSPVYVNIASAPAIRSRNLGKLFTLQLVSSSVIAHTQIFPSEGVTLFPIHLLGSNSPGATSTTGTASTAGNNIIKLTDPTKNDSKVSWQQGFLTYTLDTVDDLAPGTYVALIEVGDRGGLTSDVNYKTPTVARVNFQVKTATEEKAVANNCGSCHTDPTDTKGYRLDFYRHNKLFNNTAVDQCGNCHDYQPANATGEWSGPVPISRRVHSVHNGAHLNHPNATVGYHDTEPGRNWNIVFPQDVRSCESCHSNTAPLGTTAVSGSWKTKAARIPCSGCHDSDAAKAHFKSMTWDPTPNDPYSGDEAEACQTCH